MRKITIERDPAREMDKENHSSDGSDSEREKSNQKKEQDQKKKKPRAPILRLKPHHLTDPQNGLRKLYEATKNNKVFDRDDIDPTKKLDFLLRTTKEWHFQVMPKYNLDYFLFKTMQYGKLPVIKAYLSQMRKVHAGENTWEDFEEEKEYPEEQPPPAEENNNKKVPSVNKSDGFWSQKYLAKFKGTQQPVTTTTSQVMTNNPSARKLDQTPTPGGNQRTAVSQSQTPQTSNNINAGTNHGALQQQAQGNKNAVTSTSSVRQQQPQQPARRDDYDDYDDVQIDDDYDRMLDEIGADLPIPDDDDYADQLHQELFADEENRLDEEDLVRKIKKVRLNPPDEKQD